MKSGFSRSRMASLVPPWFAALMMRRAVEVGGLVVVALGAALLGALISYHPDDASANVASASATYRNWLGGLGATLADILMQVLGFSAYLLPVVIVAWGGMIAAHRQLKYPVLRLILALLALLVLSAFVGAFGAPAGLRISSAGGVIGALVNGKLASTLPNAWHLPGMFLLLVIFATLLAGATGASWSGIVRALRLGSGSMRAAGSLVGDTASRAGAGLRAIMPNLGQDGAQEEEAYDAAPPLRAESVGLRAPMEKRSRKEKPAAVRAEPRIAPGFAAAAEPESDDEEAEGEVAGLFAPPPSAAPRETSAPPVRVNERADRSPTLPLTERVYIEDEPGAYELPPLDLLASPKPGERTSTQDPGLLRQAAGDLEGVLGDFGVKGSIVEVRPGPVVTLFELEPAPGTKSSRVIGLSDDIARSMSAVSVRVAVVPGRNVIGIEMPNRKREMVYLRELFEATEFQGTKAKLAMALGKDISGAPIIADLAKMPHLLVAGTTGSGKSVGVNGMILSILFRLPPDRCRFIMIDPKMLELSVYNGIPHLLTPVVTEPGKAVVALKWAVREMEDRYRSMSTLGVRNIDGYNARIREAVERGELLRRRVQTGFDPDTGKPVFEEQPFDMTELPYIVVVVDEMADLMLVAGKEIEGCIQRLAQMARAAGIHLIMATQRPSVDVITGTIKANFPTRISYAVTSKIDSRTILGEQGAEQLLGQGDMLYMASGGRLTRVHGAFVSDDEVEKSVNHLKAQGEPLYIDNITEDPDEGGAFGLEDDVGGNGESGDDLYDQAIALVARERKASTSFIQRHLQIGYNRAARLIERMEKEGVVSRANHVGKREVLLPDHGDY
ncbi:DNA translocase FtsK 4TM domain-containing protein [Radicibacter daui]|uniref:DNA translocase FtsK 4TM domain-containing protein n=1 Tax=Radicibacter daui TaxID=3064829 RepID=UPI0040468C54